MADTTTHRDPNYGTDNRKWWISSVGGGRGYRVSAPFGLFIDMGYPASYVTETGIYETFHDTWDAALVFMWENDPRAPIARYADDVPQDWLRRLMDAYFGWRYR